MSTTDLKDTCAGLADSCAERGTVAAAGEDARDSQAVGGAEDGAKVLGINNLWRDQC